MNNTYIDREYFTYPIFWNGVKRFFLWFTGASDGVWTEEKRAVCWCSEDALINDAKMIGLTVSKHESTLLNLDEVHEFVRGVYQIDNRNKLDAWNLFVDIANSVDGAGFSAANAKLDDVYSRLVRGLHSDLLEGVAPEPIPKDDDDIRMILDLGLTLLEGCVRIVGTVVK